MIVRDDMVPYLRQYLTDRDCFLKKRGLKSEALFPTPAGNVYSLSNFNKIKREIEKESGVKFLIKDFRSSSASNALHVDPKLLPVVSTQLGHKDPATTQRYYARIEAGNAGIELRKALNPVRGDAYQNENAPKIPISGPTSQTISAKTPVIHSKFEMTGYN
jgi:integrase